MFYIYCKSAVRLKLLVNPFVIIFEGEMSRYRVDKC